MRLCHARRALARLATVAAFVVAVPAAVAHAEAAKPATPAADHADDFRVQLLLAEQIDRFNPGVAASRSSVAAGGLATGLEFDFHAADFWMPKKVRSKPQLILGGRLLSSERVLAQSVTTEVDTLTGEAPDSVVVFPDAKSVELVGSLRIRYPLASVNGVPQTAIYLRAESGAVFAEHMTGDLLSMTRFGLGFERTAGTFDGSLVEVTMGSNESFGSRFSSGRYTVHVLLQGVMPPPEGSKRTRSNLSGFAELEVDTDNQGGPDGVRALLGLKLDGAGLFDGVRGLLGL